MTKTPWPVAVLIAASLVVSACGQTPKLRTSVERRNVETIHAVPEAKAVSVRPRLAASWNPATSMLELTAQKELSGEMYELEAWDEATITTKRINPDPVPYLIGATMTVGLPLIFATFDDKYREEAERAFGGKELDRKEVLTAQRGEPGRPLHTTGTSLAPWPKARVRLLVEEKAIAELELDGYGRGRIRLAELIDDAQPLLANEGLALRLVASLKGETGETSAYLGPQELAAFRSVVAAHAEGAARDLLKADNVAAAARKFAVAAELGRPEAQVALAKMLSEGRGVTQNFQESAKWSKRAAAQGHPEAQYLWALALAERHEDQQAYLWAVLATAQAKGEVARNAVFQRELLVRKLKPADVERLQAQAAAFKPVAEDRMVPATAQASGEDALGLDPRRVKGKPNPKAVAIIIGVEEYEKLPAAQFAGRDARVFRDFAVEVMGIPRDRVRLLLNQDARLLDVQKVIDTWLKAELAGGATDVVVFFSGHGLASEDGREVFLLPHDGDRALLARSGIGRAALIESVVKAGAGSLTLFLDTCYSGGTRGAETLIADMRPLMIVPKETDRADGATILAAASGSQLSSAYAPARHGLFSYFLMRGLMGEADADGDRVLTLGELHRYTEDKVRRVALSQGRQQSPVLIGAADTVVARW